MIFLILFIIIPLSELYLLVYVSSQIGFLYTLALVIFTGIIGIKLVKSQGKVALNKIQTELAQGHLPSNEIIEGMLILAAGLLLITPGIFTDFIGFLLLIPFTRNFTAIMFKKHFASKFHIVNYSSFEQKIKNDFDENNMNSDSDRIVEGDWEEK